MLCPPSFLFLTLSALSIIINKEMKRGAEKTLRIGGVLWVGLVVLLGFCWLFIGGGRFGQNGMRDSLGYSRKGWKETSKPHVGFAIFWTRPKLSLPRGLSLPVVSYPPLMTFVTFWSYSSYQSNMAL